MIDALKPDAVPAPRAQTSRVILPSRAAALPPPPPPSAPSPPSRDALDTWLAGLDEGPGVARVPVQDAPAADVIRLERLTPAAPVPNTRPRPGFMLRPQTPRTAVQTVTDRWLKRLGAATFIVVAIAGALLGAPTMLDISNALVRSATKVVAAPELPPLPPAPPPRPAPAIVLPATPDISADVTLPAGEITPER
jgi:hypothetical protein